MGFQVAVFLPLGLFIAYQLIVLFQTPSAEKLQNLSHRLDEINKAKEALETGDFKSGEFKGIPIAMAASVVALLVLDRTS